MLLVMAISPTSLSDSGLIFRRTTTTIQLSCFTVYDTVYHLTPQLHVAMITSQQTAQMTYCSQSCQPGKKTGTDMEKKWDRLQHWLQCVNISNYSWDCHSIVKVNTSVGRKNCNFVWKEMFAVCYNLQRSRFILGCTLQIPFK